MRFLYIALGWVSIVVLPQLFRNMSVTGSVLVVAGGLLYTLGAIVFAAKRPDPNPAVFGYHEIFHLCTLAAAGCQYAAIAFYVLPRG